MARNNPDEFDTKLLTLARTATRQFENVTRSEFTKVERTETLDARCHIRNNGAVVPQMIRQDDEAREDHGGSAIRIVISGGISVEEIS